MKKKMILLVMAALLLVTGCTGIQTYTDSGQTINIDINQKFIIALDSNPTTGYSWQASYDESTLELVGKSYEMGEKAKQGAVGAGGVEYFQFKALKTGTTEITLIYKRPWEEQAINQKIFTVNIK